MSKVFIENQRGFYSAIPGETILEVLQRNGFTIDAPCNGLGKCGKCKVWVSGELEPVSEMEKKHLIGEEEHIRVGCLAKIKGDVNIRLLNLNDSLQGIESIQIDNEVTSNLLKEEDYSVAFDIGTTGVSGALIRKSDGATISSCSGINPQVRFGADVLSRIAYCMEKPEGRIQLQGAIVAGLNDLLDEMTAENRNLKIDKIVVSANTTMLHLLAGVDPTSLAQAPYKPVFTDTKKLNAASTGLKVAPTCELILMPSRSAYIGADVIGGLLVSNKMCEKKNILYLDIGTNGEIALCKQGRWVATSTAAGPALEGANIQCGCRARKRAVESVSLNENGKISYEVIGEEEPDGLCGTGLIDLIAVLLNSGQLDKRGKLVLNKSYQADHPFIDKKWYLTNKVFLSQKDVRQVQLAKGAIATGIRLLVKELKMTIEEIDEIRIAGAFGYHLNPDSLLGIGLLPREYQNHVEFLGNTSLMGAQEVIRNPGFLKEMEEWIRCLEVVELSLREDFQETFIRELQF